MSVLSEKLEQLEYWLWQHHPIVAESLPSGLTREEINSQAQCLPFQLSKEIQELYQWHNGCFSLFGSAYLDEGLGFLSLEKAIQYSHYQEAGHVSQKLNILGFHMFGEFERWLHFAVCNEDETSPILLVIDDPYTRLAYASVTSMVLTTLECYERGILILKIYQTYGHASFNNSIIRDFSNQDYDRLDEYTDQFYVEEYINVRDEFKKILDRNNSLFNQEAIRQKYNIEIK